MTIEIERATVRIFNKNSIVIGAGFLIAPTYILTCAHVVAGALNIDSEGLSEKTENPTETMVVDFPNLSSQKESLRARVKFWHPTKETDVAVLELLSAAPVQARSVVLKSVSNVRGHPYSAYGFHSDVGSWNQGKMNRGIANGNVQLNSEDAGYPIATGFSGTAVWDEREKAVVGMVVQTDWRETDYGGLNPTRTAYMIPTRKLCDIWKPLTQYVQQAPLPILPLTPEMPRWAEDRWEPHSGESRSRELQSVKQIGKRNYYLLERLRDDEASGPGLVRRHYKAREKDRGGEPHLVWIKQVALKRDVNRREGEEAMTALRKEGELLRKLQGQGFTFPTVEELQLWPESVTLVYACIPGNTFRTVFGKLDTPLDREDAKSLLRASPGLCRQLTRLHQARYAHRYIAPETLLLSKGGKKVAMLRDVGLATEPFRAGEGPEGYAAPEQRHDRYHLPSTDIYQLGAALYHLLTGRKVSSFRFEVAPPSQCNGVLPKALDEVLLKALRKRAEERWPSMQEFGVALQGAISEFR